jgi:hypothetical protein
LDDLDDQIRKRRMCGGSDRLRSRAHSEMVCSITAREIPRVRSMSKKMLGAAGGMPEERGDRRAAAIEDERRREEADIALIILGMITWQQRRSFSELKASE